MGCNKPKAIAFAKTHQDLDKSVSKPMAQCNPDDVIIRTFLLPSNQKGEIHRAPIKQKVIENSQKLDADQEAMAGIINFLLMWVREEDHRPSSYNQVLNYLEKDDQDDEMLYIFRPITDHHGPLDTDDPNYTGSLYNVMV